MPRVEVQEEMLAPRDHVWHAINDIEAYPQMMDHVRSVEVLERDEHQRRAAWEVEIRGCIMRWIEQEKIDEAHYRIEYHQVSGDLERFEGHWQVHPLTEGSCRVELIVDFDVGMPMLSEMLDPIATRAIHDNSRDMLLSLASNAAQQVR